MEDSLNAKKYSIYQITVKRWIWTCKRLGQISVIIYAAVEIITRRHVRKVTANGGSLPAFCKV